MKCDSWIASRVALREIVLFSYANCLWKMIADMMMIFFYGHFREINIAILEKKTHR